MGWSGGSDIAGQIIESVMQNVDSKQIRKNIYITILRVMEDNDWDTQRECEGIDPVFDQLLKDKHPKWYEGDF